MPQNDIATHPPSPARQLIVIPAQAGTQSFMYELPYLHSTRLMTIETLVPPKETAFIIP